LVRIGFDIILNSWKVFGALFVFFLNEIIEEGEEKEKIVVFAIVIA
jgi:hypothetical protein